ERRDPSRRGPRGVSRSGPKAGVRRKVETCQPDGCARVQPMLSIVAGDVPPSKERQDRERAPFLKPSTGTRGYDEASSSGGDDDQLGAESEQEADEHAPDRELPREPPADGE